MGNSFLLGAAVFATCAFTMVTVLAAQPLPRDAVLVDLPDAIEPEGFIRIDGTIIIGYDQIGFDALDVLLDAPDAAGAAPRSTIEGPRTRLLYLVPDDRSPLEVARNYRVALEELGFEEIFACSRSECGPPLAMRNLLYPLGGKLTNYGQVTEYALSFPREDHQYLAMHNREIGRTTTIWVAFDTFRHDPRTENKTMALVDVVEGAPMQLRTTVIEPVTRDGLAVAYDGDGQITLDGIFFATDSDQLTGASALALAEIAAFLNSRTDANAYVVGHSDGVGNYDYNIDLSRRRAAAVVQALIGEYGIDSSRLLAAGVGPLAPQATNQTDEGRSLNRRVDFVRR